MAVSRKTGRDSDGIPRAAGRPAQDDGQRFSVKVDAVDYPDFWTEAGAGPDARIVQAAGDFPDAACPGQQAGCAIPYARSRGTTTMTWQYHQGHADAPPSVTYLAIDITVS